MFTRPGIFTLRNAWFFVSHLSARWDRAGTPGGTEVTEVTGVTGVLDGYSMGYLKVVILYCKYDKKLNMILMIVIKQCFGNANPGPSEHYGFPL